MLDDFTEENGATLLLPGSHADRRLPSRVPGDASDADYRRFTEGSVAVTGRAGDMLFYRGQVWHSVGVNEARAPRAALLGQFLPFYVRPMEAHGWLTPQWVQRRLTPEVRRMLGLPWANFFQSAIRLAPLPRGPLAAIKFLGDTLCFGYEGTHHPALLRRGVRLFELPPWLEALALSPAVHALYLQAYRWVAIAALVVGPASVHLAWRRRQRRATATAGPPDPRLVCLLSLVVGMLVGSNLTLERLRM
jgi:hypothetical protein